MTQTSVQRSKTRFAQESITMQKNLILENLSRLSQNQQDPIPADFVATNFGATQMGTTLGDYQNFQATSQSHIFSSYSPLQFRMHIPRQIDAERLIAPSQ